MRGTAQARPATTSLSQFAATVAATLIRMQGSAGISRNLDAAGRSGPTPTYRLLPRAVGSVTVLAVVGVTLEGRSGAAAVDASSLTARVKVGVMRDRHNRSVVLH